MAKNIYIVTGLGYGDEGKGKTVHWLCAKYKAHTVVRTGGPQAFHRVVGSNGQEHVHAQFGSGTLAGASTHLSKKMVIDPYAIIAEGKSLKDELGISGVFEGLTIHRDALVITPFQAIANRLKELMRGDAKYGSVGVGVGETVLDAEVFPKEAIRAKDLTKPYLADKLDVIRERKIIELKEVISGIDSLPKDVQERAKFELRNLKSDDTMIWAIGWFAQLAAMSNIVDDDYVAKNILGRDGTVVFEGSQGVLLDRWYGFHPYTTKVRTIPEIALSLIGEYNYDGKVRSLGVLRAYHTRHGGGPFVAECPELTRQLPDATNGNHTWQGNFRVGCFDMVAAKYAIDVCGDTIDELVITCMDRVKTLQEWPVCEAYGCLYEGNTASFFSRNDEGFIDRIIVSPELGDLQIKRQESLGRLLRQCYGKRTIFKTTDPIFIGFQYIRDKLNIPVLAVSTGPTEKDCIEPEYQIDLGYLE